MIFRVLAGPPKIGQKRPKKAKNRRFWGVFRDFGKKGKGGYRQNLENRCFLGFFGVLAKIYNRSHIGLKKGRKWQFSENRLFWGFLRVFEVSRKLMI